MMFLGGGCIVLVPVVSWMNTGTRTVHYDSTSNDVESLVKSRIWFGTVVALPAKAIDIGD
jgi:hypothetical protein